CHLQLGWLPSVGRIRRRPPTKGRWVNANEVIWSRKCLASLTIASVQMPLQGCGSARRESYRAHNHQSDASPTFVGSECQGFVGRVHRRACKGRRSVPIDLGVCSWLVAEFDCDTHEQPCGGTSHQPARPWLCHRGSGEVAARFARDRRSRQSSPLPLLHALW